MKNKIISIFLSFVLNLFSIPVMTCPNIFLAIPGTGMLIDGKDLPSSKGNRSITIGYRNRNVTIPLTTLQREQEINYNDQLLHALTTKLYSGGKSTYKRLAASQLSMKQEDGLSILSYALFDPRSEWNTKTAAAYGIGKMWSNKQGRMKQQAIRVLLHAIDSADEKVQHISMNRLYLLFLGKRNRQLSNILPKKVRLLLLQGLTSSTLHIRNQKVVQQAL